MNGRRIGEFPFAETHQVITCTLSKEGSEKREVREREKEREWGGMEKQRGKRELSLARRCFIAASRFVTPHRAAAFDVRRLRLSTRLSRLLLLISADGRPRCSWINSRGSTGLATDRSTPRGRISIAREHKNGLAAADASRPLHPRPPPLSSSPRHFPSPGWSGCGIEIPGELSRQVFLLSLRERAPSRDAARANGA